VGNYQQENWKHWLSLSDDNVRQVLEDAAKTIAWAWGTDKRDFPKSYPANTGEVFFQIKEQIKEIRGFKKNVVRKATKIRFAPFAPKRFSELISDEPIRNIYETQNADRYEDALKRAACGDRRTFRKLLKAADGAYMETIVGVDAMPKPRINFLHRHLLELAELSGLITDLTSAGMVNFLDDLCPCGKGHEEDAIRKYRKRWAGTRNC
jgi:hypothetical protein